MDKATPNLAALAETLEALRQQVARLGERLAALEVGAAAAGRDAPPATTPKGAIAPDTAGLSEELLLVISAGIAAFLGKRPHIRQIRLLGSAAWAQQGRVAIQASHARLG
jgi:methylmalonyl-CoA carboxyltransferase large subunit